MVKISQVNKKLLPMKAHYFLYNAGTAPVVPFLSTYARQLGFSSVVVGLIYTILPICGMLAKPTVGAIADHFKCQKLCFLLAQLLTAAAFIAVYYSPSVPLQQTVHFSCTDGLAVFDTSPLNTSIDQCVKDQLESQTNKEAVECNLDCDMDSTKWDIVVNHWNIAEFQSNHPDRLKLFGNVIRNKTIDFDDVLTFVLKNTEINGKLYDPLCTCGDACHLSTLCQLDCDDYTINDIVAQPSISDNDLYQQYEFWIFLILMIIAWLGQAIVVSVGDAICFELLTDQPNKYGYQRLFGAIGWGIFSPIAGLMVDALSVGSSKKNFISAFYLAAVFMIFDFLVSYKLNYVQKKVSTNIFRDVGRLLTDLRIIVFLIFCIGIGMCTALMWNFLFWLIEDLAKEQGCNTENWIKTLEGVVMFVQTVGGEFPFFFLSGWILKRIGHTNAITLVLFAFGIRFILYSVITNPWWFIPVELLNGLTFGLFYACMASYASIVAPPGTEATMQGLVGSIFEGVGVSLGSLLAGIFYNDYGGPKTFRIFGIASLVAFLLHGLIQYGLSMRNNHNNKNNANNNTDYRAKYATPKDALQQYNDDDDQQELTLVGS